MRKKPFETLVYSALGLAAMFVILIAVNFIAARFKQRVDLTQEKAYTLSHGTKAILKKLDTPVQIRLYSSREEAGMPVFLRTYAQRVEDLLGEYVQNGHGQVTLQKLDPEPDSDAEDSAKLDGVNGQQLPDGSKVYLGLSISMLDKKQAISFLTPDRERLLEYDVSRALSQVITPEKPVVGVMSALPVMGGPPSNPMMMEMGQQQAPQPAWAFITELKNDYDVKSVEMSADKIPEDIKVLLLIHPKGITDAGQYALDQFILRGGKLIAFLDPLCVLDRQNPMGGEPSSSNIDKLLKGWGVSLDTSKVVADMSYVAETRQGKAPTVLALTQNAFNKDDILTADADDAVMAFAGTFTGTPVKGLKEDILIRSSTESQLVDPMTAQMSAEGISNDFHASGTGYPLAIRLTGKFATAFPGGAPAAEAKPSAPPSPPAPVKPGLKESAQENTVLLFGDVDMLEDQVAVRAMQNPFGQDMVMPANGNLAIAENAVDQLTGDSNLITVRSRASRERPFTVVKKMQEDAEANYRDKIKGLEASLADTQNKINGLQQGKESQNGQQFILSPEQQQELEKFRKTEASAKVELKGVRKTLRAEIDSLETRLEWLNIAGMPALVAASGILLATMKRNRSSAQ